MSNFKSSTNSPTNVHTQFEIFTRDRTLSGVKFLNETFCITKDRQYVLHIQALLEWCYIVHGWYKVRTVLISRPFYYFSCWYLLLFCDFMLRSPMFYFIPFNLFLSFYILILIKNVCFKRVCTSWMNWINMYCLHENHILHLRTTNKYK